MGKRTKLLWHWHLRRRLTLVGDVGGDGDGTVHRVALAVVVGQRPAFGEGHPAQGAREPTTCRTRNKQKIVSWSLISENKDQLKTGD